MFLRFSWVADDTKIIHVEGGPAKFSNAPPVRCNKSVVTQHSCAQWDIIIGSVVHVSQLLRSVDTLHWHHYWLSETHNNHACVCKELSIVKWTWECLCSRRISCFHTFWPGQSFHIAFYNWTDIDLSKRLFDTSPQTLRCLRLQHSQVIVASN